MSRAPRHLRTPEPEPRSEFLDAMQQAADILTGKLAPARVHTPESTAAAAGQAAGPMVTGQVKTRDLSLDAGFARLLLDSYHHLVGRPLVDTAAGEEPTAHWLYQVAPFCLLAHDTQADPCFVYANRAAQACFGYSWDEFMGLPSRLSAEAPNRDERRRLLEAVTRDGYIDHYRGLRIAKSGRRFWIENAVVWELRDAHGSQQGQAAAFRTWRDQGSAE